MRCLSILLFGLVVVTDAVKGSPGQQPLVGLTGTQPAHTMEGWSYENCGLPTDPVQIESITVVPDPPQPGKNLTVIVKANAVEKIDDGAYADVTVKLGMVKLLHKRFDVCEEARKANAAIQCPVERGVYEVEQIVLLPKEIPKAKFNIDVRGYTVSDDDLLCLQLKVDFMKHWPHPW